MSIDVLGVLKSRRAGVGACALLLGALIVGLSYRNHHLQTTEESQASGAHCDDGVGAAKSRTTVAVASVTAADPIASASEAAWTPKINDAKPPGPAPAGMIWIPGGAFWMGTDDPHMPDAKPWHRVYVDGFWMDRTVVTNEQFAEFVKATGYVTVAERKPRAEDYPGAIPENLIAGSVVFTPPKHPVELYDHFQWWSYVAGANWRRPEGPGSDIKSRMNHPVVHVAYEDAVAYCKWAGKRLPTEAEFEFASRGGLDRKRYDWGDELRPGGKTMANTFQGHFPDTNTGEDGYKATAPVGSFPANGFGLVDMSGNVWEWTSDWWSARHEADAAKPCCIPQNPRGGVEDASYDPCQPAIRIPRKVLKGGSHLCAPNYCRRYRPAARHAEPVDTSTSHVGFRCVVRSAVPPVKP